MFTTYGTAPQPHHYPGSDKLFGEGGTDAINTLEGVRANDLADGGTGRDTCTTNAGYRKRSCP